MIDNLYGPKSTHLKTRFSSKKFGYLVFCLLTEWGLDPRSEDSCWIISGEFGSFFDWASWSEFDPEFEAAGLLGTSEFAAAIILAT